MKQVELFDMPSRNNKSRDMKIAKQSKVNKST